MKLFAVAGKTIEDMLDNGAFVQPCLISPCATDVEGLTFGLLDFGDSWPVMITSCMGWPVGGSCILGSFRLQVWGLGLDVAPWLYCA